MRSPLLNLPENISGVTYAAGIAAAIFVVVKLAWPSKVSVFHDYARPFP